MGDAKLCIEVVNAIGSHTRRTFTLDEAREEGWKKLNELAYNGNSILIFDTTPDGTPIRAVMLGEVGSNGKIMVMTTCQVCGNGQKRACQDVWQSARCDDCKGSRKRSKPKPKPVGGKYVSDTTESVKMGMKLGTNTQEDLDKAEQRDRALEEASRSNDPEWKAWRKLREQLAEAEARVDELSKLNKKE